MKNSMYMPALALYACASAVVPTMSFAEESSFSIDPPHSLEHVLVTVPFQRKEAETALPVTVVSGEQLRNQVASTLGESLAKSPGLTSANFGPAVGQPVIRGQQGPRVSVLQNSLYVGDASNVSVDHGVAIEPVLAKSIEVLRGPSTLLYGGGAIGGVVNVIDNRIPTKQMGNVFDIELRHASVDDESTAVFRGGVDVGAFTFHLDGLSRKTSDVEIPGWATAVELESDAALDNDENTFGFIANSDSDTASVTLGGSYLFDKGLFGLATHHFELDYGIPAGTHVHHDEHEEGHHEEGDHEEDHHEGDLDDEDVRIEMTSDRHELRFILNNLSPFIESLDWRSAYSDYIHFERESDGNTEFKNRLWQNRLQLVHAPVGSWHGVFGMQQQRSDFAIHGSGAFTPDSVNSNLGVFALETLHREKLTLEFGARWEQADLQPSSERVEDKRFQATSFSGSALVHFSENWHLGVAGSHSERAPSAEELFSNSETADGEEYKVHIATGVIEVGNPWLKTEQSNNLDLSVNWTLDNVDGFVTLYHNQFEGYIFLRDIETTQDGVEIFEYSQASALFVGAEMELNWRLGKRVSTRWFGDLVRGELGDGSALPRMPGSRVGAEVRVEAGAWHSEISFIHGFEQDDIGEHETVTPAYTLVDTSINYEPSWLDGVNSMIYFRVKNVGDEEVRMHTSFLKDKSPEPGRSFEFGVRVSH